MVVWLSVSIKYTNLITTDDITLGIFSKLIFCILPDVMGIIIPLSFTIALTHVFYKMRIDREIIVIMTSGKSVQSIVASSFVFAIMLSITMYNVRANISPISYKSLSNIQQKIKSKVSMAVIKPGVFNSLGNSLVYIGEKTNNSLKDVFVSYISKNLTMNIITAEHGGYEMLNNRVFITLINGFRQVLNSKNEVIQTLRFDKFSYDITEFIKKYTDSTKNLHSKTQDELFAEAKKEKDYHKRLKLLSEANGRYVMSFLPIVNMLWVAIFLLRRRRKLWFGCASSFFLSVVCQLLLTIAVNLAGQYEFLLFYNYIFVLVCIVFLLYVFFCLKKNEAV
jgi:lipopolysaccharide export LptBFGC system permease protein LptF